MSSCSSSSARPTSARRRVRADPDRPRADADPPHRHPGHQHLGQPGAQHRPGAVRRWLGIGQLWLFSSPRSWARSSARLAYRALAADAAKRSEASFKRRLVDGTHGLSLQAEQRRSSADNRQRLPAVQAVLEDDGSTSSKPQACLTAFRKSSSSIGLDTTSNVLSWLRSVSRPNPEALMTITGMSRSDGSASCAALKSQPSMTASLCRA